MRTIAIACMLSSLLIAPSVAGQAIAQAELTREQVNQIQRDCATIDQCIKAMRTETAVNFSATLEKKFEGFGEAAVPALMQVLTTNPDAKMRHYAGIALRKMPRIDVRYLPALIKESRAGPRQPSVDDGPSWLAIPIGLVRNNPDALNYLFDIAEEYGNRASSNTVQPAIQRSNRDVWMVEARRRMESFRPEQSGEYLAFLCDLVKFGWPRPTDPTPPDWLEPALVRIAGDARSNSGARSVAEYHLRSFRNPIALAAIIRDARVQFAGTPSWDGASRFVRIKDSENEEQWERLSDGSLEITISQIGRFEHTAREAAPLVRPFLARPDLPDSRAEAALTLGLIGDQGAIPDLLIALQDKDDWLLAYNAAEALALLGAKEARKPLTETAQRHWSEAVRRNAERALSVLDGSAWALPGDPKSGHGINTGKNGEDYLYFGPFRYVGDDIGNQADCLADAEREVAFPQSRLSAPRFPNRGAVILMPRAVDRTEWPDLPDSVRKQMPRGDVLALARLNRGWLFGTNAGEFVGGLSFVLRRDKSVTRVVPDNIQLLFRHGERVYALTGLSHLVSSYGEVWEIDVKGDVPRAVRRIRLPSEATSVLATAGGDIALSTREDTFLLSRDGVLHSGEDAATCAR